jgi:hypothetical protein
MVSNFNTPAGFKTNNDPPECKAQGMLFLLHDNFTPLLGLRLYRALSDTIGFSAPSAVHA